MDRPSFVKVPSSAFFRVRPLRDAEPMVDGVKSNRMNSAFAAMILIVRGLAVRSFKSAVITWVPSISLISSGVSPSDRPSSITSAPGGLL